MRKLGLVIVAAMIAVQFGLWPQHVVQAATIRDITFPVIGTTSYSDDFGNARVGHTHEGNDIFGKKLQPLVAAVDGTATVVEDPEPSYGWYITITDADGYHYNYLHINNDTPGTDDGLGGAMNAYAPGTARSWTVKRGQVIAYLGDSGNAETTSPHLHFEIRLPNDTAIDPYQSLRAAKHEVTAVPTAQQAWELLPFGNFKVGTNVAVGDVIPSNPGNELVVGSGAGTKPQIRIMSQQGQALGNFFLPTGAFLGGVDVAVGDVNGDGVQEIIAGLGAGAEPKVYVLDRTGTILSQFDAYTPRFRGGLRVSTVDFDGNGTAEIITGAGATGGPEVRTYTGSGQFLSSFYAYTSKFRGGVDVAGVSAMNGTPGWIVTSPGNGGGPDVRVYNQFGTLRSSSYAGESSFRGGLHVSTAIDVTTSQPTIFTVPATGGAGLIRSFSLDGVPGQTWSIYEEWWRGGYDVTADSSMIVGTTNTNNRRSSVALIPWQSITINDLPWWHW